MTPSVAGDCGEACGVLTSGLYLAPGAGDERGRCLKRCIARELYRALTKGMTVVAAASSGVR